MAIKLLSKGQAKSPSVRTVPVEEHAKLKKWYSEMLLRKDREIEELKRNNDFLMKTALKRAAENDDLKRALAELRESKNK